jgi:hypothetical protein
MAVLDIVSPRIPQGSPIQPQPTHYGTVTAEPAAGQATVLWDTAVPPIAYVAVTDAALNLDVIEDADANAIGTFRGKTVLRIAPNGPVPGDPAGGTSREFVGTVVGIYRRRQLTFGPGPFPPGPVYLSVQSGNLFFEDLAANFTTR